LESILDAGGPRRGFIIGLAGYGASIFRTIQ
jgi:hypothetical protein